MSFIHDNRCKKVDNYIIITNYKCMFSSLSKLSGTKASREDLDEYEVVFIYRDPLIRLISCFLHWGIRSPKSKKVDQQGNIGGWLLQLFDESDNVDLEDYKIKIDNLNNNEDIINIFKIFMDVLSDIYTKNKHLHQQNKIICDNNINVDIYINSDNEQDVTHLETLIDTKFNVCNKSDKKQKTLLYDFLKVNSYYLNIVNNIYRDDLELYNRINPVR